MEAKEQEELEARIVEKVVQRWTELHPPTTELLLETIDRRIGYIEQELVHLYASLQSGRDVSETLPVDQALRIQAKDLSERFVRYDASEKRRKETGRGKKMQPQKKKLRSSSS